MSTSDKAGAVAERWDAPSIDGGDDQGFLTAARLEELQKQAYDEAYAEGRSAGLAAGETDVAARVARLDELLAAMAKPYEQLDESVEKALVELAMTVVRQLFRREVKLEPSHVVGVVREAIQVLPDSARDVRVHLHPEDAELVRSLLVDAEGERAWSIVEDPLVARGGCTVNTETSQVDARTESRVDGIVNAITGDERNS